MPMDDLISRKAAIQAIADMALGKCVADEETDDNETCKEKSAMFKAHQDSLMAIRHLPSIPAVPLDKLCEFLADTLHTPAPCFNNEEICPRMDFGYCRLPDAHDVKECWKKILTKWTEGLDVS